MSSLQMPLIARWRPSDERSDPSLHAAHLIHALRSDCSRRASVPGETVLIAASVIAATEHDLNIVSVILTAVRTESVTSDPVGLHLQPGTANLVAPTIVGGPF